MFYTIPGIVNVLYGYQHFCEDMHSSVMYVYWWLVPVYSVLHKTCVFYRIAVKLSLPWLKSRDDEGGGVVHWIISPDFSKWSIGSVKLGPISFKKTIFKGIFYWLSDWLMPSDKLNSTMAKDMDLIFLMLDVGVVPFGI